MSMYRDKFSVLIQVPASMSSLNNLENYLNYGDVVVSTWNGYEDDILEIIGQFENCKLISEETPSRENIVGALKDSTFYYALKGMYYGLKHVETEYVIKTRSDEFYGNLGPFVEEFLKNDDKLVCGNIFVRSDVPYHFGDHVFICKTKDVLSAIDNLLKSYESQQELQSWMIQMGSTAENILCSSILKSKNIDTTQDYKRVFLDNITIIDINLCKPFLAMWQHGKKVYDNTFVNHHGIYKQNDYK